MKRFGTEYGGFYYPEKLYGLDQNSIIYCIGAGEDISHDIEIGHTLNSNIYIIDPTPRAIKHYNHVKNVYEKNINPNFNNKIGGGEPYNYWTLMLEKKIDINKIIYKNYAIGVNEGKHKFFLPNNEENVSCSLVEGMKGEKYINVDVKKLKTIMNELKHNKIDLLKMDIEGSECDVIENMLEDKIYPKYLAVEFDLAFNGEKIKDIEKCNKTIEKLIENNYELIYRNHSDFTFVHYLYYEGRPHGLGNRIEEIIKLEVYAEKYNYIIDYYWNNSIKDFMWNEYLVKANFNINLKSKLVNIIQNKKNKNIFKLPEINLLQKDILNAGKNIKPLFNIKFRDNIKPIGIHIRGTDRINEGIHNMTIDYFNKIFLKIVNIINENNYEYIFVCSENNYYKEELKKNINKNIKIIEPIIENIDENNDIIDLFSLSLCSKIYLCSKFSSYSIIASIIGNIPIICNYDEIYENEIENRYKALIEYLPNNKQNIDKNITIYSTCQGEGIKYYLRYYFNYNRITVLHNYNIIKNKENININLLKNTDIFIYQEMGKKWGIYSTDETEDNNIIKYLRKDCIKIIIPYVYADWLWSINKILLRDITHNFDEIDNLNNCYKYLNEDIIVNLKKQNHSIENILEMYDNDKLDFNFNIRKNNSINILKNKEKTCMIKISDFILENYKDKELFLTNNHPTYIILKEMTKQILKILNINNINFNENDIYEIHPMRLIHSKYDKKNINYNINIDDNKIKEYIIEIYNKTL